MPLPFGPMAEAIRATAADGDASFPVLLRLYVFLGPVEASHKFKLQMLPGLYSKKTFFVKLLAG